jgi:hypothetical protein
LIPGTAKVSRPKEDDVTKLFKLVAIFIERKPQEVKGRVPGKFCPLV